MVDEYNSGKKRTLEEVRARAKIVQDNIDQSSAEHEQCVKKYMVLNKAKKGKRTKEPKFGRGARRKRFASDAEHRACDECYESQERVDCWKKEKASLLKTLMFFAISMLKTLMFFAISMLLDDDPVANPSMFIDFARDYHERWGIENGFRDVKQRFLSKGRSRKPCMRQFRLVLGMMLYNRWEIERKRIARASYDQDQIKTRGWIRRKHEQEIHSLPTAVGFLVTA
ncbi:MAG: transposase [Candidatus Lokiarchaeota archaeon]|nr:transposase [Candidatus Lokiarchaeota archaeon]